MALISDRDEFFNNIRSALGRIRDPSIPVGIDGDALFLQHEESVEATGESSRIVANDDLDDLLLQLENSAAQAGWKVARVPDEREATRYIVDLARDLGAHSILRTSHTILDVLDLDNALSGAGITLGLMAVDEGLDGTERDEQRELMRSRAAAADMGVTGVEYAIAETGTCVLLARRGVSRIVSLLPPVHVAVVQKADVLPGLEELFTLRKKDFLRGNLGSYMTLISGPSRSADIEHTLVTGVHGPGEVHMVMIG